MRRLSLKSTDFGVDPLKSTLFGVDPPLVLTQFLQVALKQHIIYLLNGAGGEGRTRNLKLGNIQSS